MHSGRREWGACPGWGRGECYAGMMSDGELRVRARGPFAGESSKDGEVVLVLEGNVSVEEGKQLGEKGGEGERVGRVGFCEVPLGRVKVEYDREMRTFHR